MALGNLSKAMQRYIAIMLKTFCRHTYLQSMKPSMWKMNFFIKKTLHTIRNNKVQSSKGLKLPISTFIKILRSPIINRLSSKRLIFTNGTTRPGKSNKNSQILYKTTTNIEEKNIKSHAGSKISAKQNKFLKKMVK